MSARAAILNCLRAHPGSTSAFVWYRAGAGIDAFGAVQHELLQLVREGLVTPKLATDPRRPGLIVYYAHAETIGDCELCGQVDHHLIEGVCPCCRRRLGAAA